MKDFPDWFFDKTDWQEKTLGEVCKINPSTGELPENFYYIDLESVVKGNLIKSNLIEKISAPSRAQRILSVDDVIFQMVRPYQQNNYFFEAEKDFPTVASTGYAQIRANENISSKFLYFYFDSDNFLNQVLIKCVGGTYPAINAEELKNLKIKLPPLETQKKIADYFTHLDNAINAQDIKLKSWRDAKKAMLQKIFSQEFYFTTGNGEKYPAWQEKNFDDIFKDVSEKNFPDLEVLTIMQGYGTVPRRNSGIDIKFTEESKKNYKKVSEGDFIIHLRSFQGGFEMANSEGIVSPAYTILKNKLPIAKNFYKNYFRSHNFISGKLAKFVEGIRDGRQINYNQLKTVKIPFPCLEEQKKIADYFSSLDKIIDAENKILENLRLMKKGLLQKLFV